MGNNQNNNTVFMLQLISTNNFGNKSKLIFSIY
jgi:hypothetical protein